MIPSENTLPDILRLAWQGKTSLSWGAALGVALGAALFFIMVPQYEAKMIIAPPTQSSEGRSLTILNENPASSRMTSVQSQVSRDYIKFQQTFREVTASRVLLKYPGILAKVNNDKIFNFGRGPEIKTAEELSEYIKAHVTIDPVGATTSEVIIYRHPDQEFAVKFLRHLHKINDEIIRNEARQQTDNRIAYLQKSLKETYNPDHRKALTDQLMLEERQRMVISMDEPFSADVIESSSVSSKPVWPKYIVLLSLCGLIGAFFGFMIFSLRNQK